ncbi:uncharacterized protein LOC132036580 isoform X2 [Lycium ferocissimum]|uniref:uncharacterized protein LOC132036580 isoform X2 n=1 Tax=Lycium ferocissimum TaxID=112874 RepID=UPI00281647DC|nr:uncharacterized protein LOC132036580 isoform X2 [Lycium ferocissimum]
MQSLLGFRPPQFSEEAAWLPGWLQQHDIETNSSYNATNIGKPFSHQHMEEMIQQHNAVASYPQSTQEDGYNSCHLFLSGVDSSPLSLVQPIDNVVQFHLHLSVGCSSENLPSTLEDISEAERIKFSHALPVQCVQIPTVPEGKANKLKVNNFAALGKGSNNTNKGEGHERNASLREVNHMDDAIELSIAASEALVIHEVFKDESFSKIFPASTVLEAALQVKQARLEAWKESHESCNSATEEIPEIDSLSESEDLRMEDAFQDVGLSASDSADLHFHDLSLSHVKDTLASQTQRCSGNLEKEGAVLHEIDILQPGDGFTKLNLTDIENESQLKVDKRFGSFSDDGQRKPTRDLNLVVDIIPMARESDHMSDCLKKVNFPVMEGNLSQASIGSPSVKNINVAGEGDELPKVVPKRFESRWFGGWTSLKEVNSSDQVKCNAIRSIPEAFVGETSYFSESADIAPDESSFVARKQDERVIIASQLSLPSEGLCNKAKEMTLVSQDIATSSNISLDDILCSVVPCSISSDHLSSPSVVYNHAKDEKQQCFDPTTECATNLQKNSFLDNQVVDGEQVTTPKINGEGIHLPVRREVASLRTYCVLPSNGTSSEKGYCFDTSFSLGRNDVPMLKPVGQMTYERRNCNDTPKDGNEFTVAMPKNTSSPLILNPGPRRRFQASKAFQPDFGTEKDGKQTTEDQAVIECPKRKRVRFSETETEFQASKSFQPDSGTEKDRKQMIDDQAAIECRKRKRVRFSETETESQPSKEPRKSHVALQSCHTPKAARNLRPPTSHVESRTQELKNRLMNSGARGERRLMLKNMEFLVTGFSRKREKKLEDLIKKYGGTVLSDIPPPTNRGKRCKGFTQAVPVVLCSKKLQTIKFLYGRAVNAFMLKAKWLTDSISEGCILPPEQYMVVKKYVGKRFIAAGRSVQNNRHSPIFDNLGIMLHGERKFCTDMAKIIKSNPCDTVPRVATLLSFKLSRYDTPFSSFRATQHGGGQVFKTLLELVQNRDSEKIVTGVIITENERSASRHLKHCASEGNISIASAYWIIRSLQLGKLLPLKEKKKSCKLPTLKLPEFPDTLGLSQEI